MKEIRFHGRGGQGAVTSSYVLAIAAFHDGKFSQAFPAFGVERRGAPVLAFTRIDDKQINVRSQVYEPDYLVVLDSSLIEQVNVLDGVEKATVIINSEKKESEFMMGKNRAFTVDITKIALDVIGKPFVNIGVLGAFAALTGEVSINSIKKAVAQAFEGNEKRIELNSKCAEKVFEESKKKYGK
ncbi:MAG: pyruvate ferredoxin oxidoreductase subunit gamma [archaeon]